MKCWAFNKARQRCILEVEDHDLTHNGDMSHAFVMRWEDDECYDPADAPVPFVPTAPWPTRIGGSVVKGEGVLRTFNEAEGIFEDTIIEEDVDLLGETGTCFSCGCSEDEHPCEKHGCRNYVP